METLALDDLRRAAGRWAKARLIRDKLFPPAEYMCRWSPVANKGRLGLMFAYGLRLGSVVGRLPLGIYGWWQVRRHVGRR